MGVKLVERIKKRNWQVLDIVLILLLGLLSLTWFRGDFLIAGGDFGIPFDRAKYFQVMFSVWDETISLGNPDYRQVASLIPYALSGAMTQYLGLSLVVWEKLLFYIWFAGSGLSMYYLCSVLGMKRFGRIAATLFYMLNPFSLIIIWRVSHALIQMPYAFAPLYLGLYINGLQKKRGLGYIGLAVLIWLFTTTSAYAWPAAAIIHWIPIFLYFLSVLILKPEVRAFTFKFTLIFFATWLAFNFYWLFPFVVSISESVASAHSPVLLSDIETLKLTSVKLGDAIRLLGFWSLHGGYKGEPYYPYEALYNSPLILLISWLIPLLTLVGLFYKKMRDRKLIVVFFLSVIIFGLLGIKGPYDPFGNIVTEIYQRFPSVVLLTRFTFLFFGIPTYMIFSVLLGFGFLFIRDWGLKRVNKLIYLPLALLSVLLFVVLVLPFWTGEVVRSEGKLWPGERVKIPAYWWEAKKWLSEQKDFFRILPLPMSKTYNVAFAWEKGYTGGDPTRWLTEQPVLFVNTGWTFNTPELIGEMVEKEDNFGQLAKLLGILNTKYLLIREDTRWQFLQGHNWWFNHNLDNMGKFINNQKDLTLEKEFGNLKFYKINVDYLLPHIYIPQDLILVNGGPESIADIATFLNLPQKPGIIFLNQNKEIIDQNKNKISFLSQPFDEIYISETPSISIAEKAKPLTLREVSDTLPHVRVLPDSPLYPLIRLKESLQELLSLSGNKWELEMRFFSKRLKEAYLLAMKGNNDLAVKTIRDANSRWDDIERKARESGGQEPLKRVSDQVVFYETFLRAFRNELLFGNPDLQLEQVINQLDATLKIKSKNALPIQNLNPGIKSKIKTSELIYNLEVPRSGDYGIYLRNDDFSRFYSPRDNSILVKIDGGDYEKFPLKISDGNIIFVAKINLDQGPHEIILSAPESINLVSNPSFEEGVWGEVMDITAYSLLKPEISSKQSSDVADGRFSLRLSTDQNTAATFAHINNFKPGQIYKVSFSARHLAGEQPRFSIWENEDKTLSPRFNTYSGPWGSPDPQTNFSLVQKLLDNYEWTHYEFIFKPNVKSQAAGIVFYADPPEIGGTANLYDDVKVERVFTNPILLKYSSGQNERKTPSVSFTKLIPTRYEVEIKGASDPYFLVFSESYHPGWKLSVEGKHLVMNGFANGWYITKPGDYKITIEFAPQKIYYLSGGVSILAFLTLLGHLLLKRKKRK